MKFPFNQIIKALAADPPVGGLEISDTAVRFVLLNEDRSVGKQAVVPLPAGAVRGGRLADHGAFFAALVALRKEIGGRRDMPIIISLPAAPVYAQVFSMPLLPKAQLEEAARLNLRMLSPIDFDAAYADWQAVGDDEHSSAGGAAGTIDALGAFVESLVVDEYARLLVRARFLPVAVEFASLSLARLVHESPEINPHDSYVMFSITGDGVTLLILKDSSSFFTRFVGWDAFGAPPISVLRFESVIGAEIRRLFNFYNSKWAGTITKAFIVNTTANDELPEWIKKEFSLEVFLLSGYHILDRTWLVAVGAALRGLIPRVQDMDISLARVGTEDDFIRNRVWRFIAVWRAIVFTIMACIIFGFIAVDLMVIRMEKAAEGQARAPYSVKQEETAALEAQAEQFNQLVAKAAFAKEEVGRWSGIVKSAYAVARGRVTLTQVQLNAPLKTLTINGTAGSEQAVIAFKNELAHAEGIQDVSLPLSAIVAVPGGTASFTATITLK